jgi:hypothetical protein
MRKLPLLFLMLIAVHGVAQKSKPAPTAAPGFSADMYKGLSWRNIGPFRGGRSNTVAGVVQDPQTYYAGYTGGGVWKTEDAGYSWKNISDGFFGVGTIGDIAVSESDPNIIYVGTGEHAIRRLLTWNFLFPFLSGLLPNRTQFFALSPNRPDQ